MTEIHPAAQVAADWWVQVLRNPKYDNGGDGLASMLMVLAAPPAPSEEALQRFGEALASDLTKALEDAPRWGITVSVDYGPDMRLNRLAQTAGMKASFPWKTTMWVSPDKVTVSYGYGAPQEILWGVEAHQEESEDA